MKTKKVIIYTRTSAGSVEQDYIKAQTKLCQAYCKDNNLESIAVIDEKGAKTEDNLPLITTIEVILASGMHLDGIVVTDYSRICRNINGLKTFLQAMQHLGMTIYTVNVSADVQTSVLSLKHIPQTSR